MAATTSSGNPAKPNAHNLWAFLLLAIAVGLAWAIRGQHGHERGAAFAGAVAGLGLAAITGHERWVWAAAVGSLGFAVGGAISYGWFVGQALAGSLAAWAAVVATGALWGALGSGALGWGLSAHRRGEWLLIVGILMLGWAWMDGPLSIPLAASGWVARLWLLGALALLVVLALWRASRPVASADGRLARASWPAQGAVVRRLSAAGALGWGLGFPLGIVWLAVGPATGWSVDWWKWMEHTIGACGGLALAWQVTGWREFTTPALSPWHRWAAFGWLFIGIPSWLWANNLVYWGWERRGLPVAAVIVLGCVLIGLVAGSLLVGASAVRARRWLQRPWSQASLRGLFVGEVWIGVLTAIAKTVAQGWGVTQTVFVGCAVWVTGMAVWRRPRVS